MASNDTAISAPTEDDTSQSCSNHHSSSYDTLLSVLVLALVLHSLVLSRIYTLNRFTTRRAAALQPSSARHAKDQSDGDGDHALQCLESSGYIASWEDSGESEYGSARLHISSGEDSEESEDWSATSHSDSDSRDDPRSEVTDDEEESDNALRLSSVVNSWKGDSDGEELFGTWTPWEGEDDNNEADDEDSEWKAICASG